MIIHVVLALLTTVASAQQPKPATITFRCEHAPPDAVVAITSVSDPIEWREITRDSASIRSRESVTLECNVDGPTTAELHIGEQYAKLFLEPGMHLTISVDYDAFDSTLTFEGDGAANQRYLLRELLHDFQTPQSKYTLFTDAATYRRYIDSVQSSHRDFFRTSDTLAMTPSFRRYAASVIEYQYVYSLNMFSVTYDPATQQFSDRELPDWFYSSVRILPLNDDVMAADPHYMTAVDVYLNRFVIKGENDLRTVYRKIDSTLSGSVQDVQLGTFLRRRINALVRDQTIGDSLVSAYESTCTSPGLSSIIRRQYNLALSLRKGQPAPNVSAIDINGEPHTLQELKGKVVYVDIWATWCLPCVAAMKASRELRREFSTDDVAFVYIAFEDDIERWRSYLKKNDLGPHAWFADEAMSEQIQQRIGVHGIPRYMIIDRDGNIYSAEARGPEGVKATLQELVGQ
jgi:thiol-disulfide isomerase/thioredoxin